MLIRLDISNNCKTQKLGFSIIEEFKICLDSSFVLDVLPLRANMNPATAHRLFYTDFGVLNSFKANAFTMNVSTSRFGLATPRILCEVVDVLCPQLIQIMHVKSKGVPRLMALAEATREGAEIIDEAGYVGAWPGYCGTSNAALVEMRSPILDAYSYATSSDDLFNARYNRDSFFWHPTRVLGFMFSANEIKKRVDYPFNAIRPFESEVFNKIIITLKPLIVLRNEKNQTAMTVYPKANSMLKGDTPFFADVSVVDSDAVDFPTVQDACGKMTMLMETFDYDTGVYSVRNLRLRALGKNEQVLRSAGFVFNEQFSSKRCLDDVEPIIEMQNTNNTKQFELIRAKYVELYEKLGWKSLGQIGYASWGNFAFAQR
ncbi:unnamed protein product [Caenorhabditis bovis]|uniref:Uncharacterized protein n=1 Tax=Caenorhabditis bovis TaxID=2654633 RepID=A0A8S1FCH8_9PELO|nr:unnamed protein product [Caenorhabditis bovis]